ncbi:DUF4249 domain-containing protein [Hymenobacter sp. BRD128]|uniref:DUF4249 domain-containing protein n=1 Tax=Hymenobacter sp. BRD128 TaxID=2675878 RepID=UPI001567C054|nr:DUF4249 domain-containing protein [Hymenobacter sp. BRD128]QKG57817.1 DUF4249 domain-containing protein [Hymenobacter sp. BRD128]
MTKRCSYFRIAAAGLAVLLALGAGGCVEAYLPEVVSANANLLVVDGFINGNGRTRIRLSRSENIAATTTPPAQKGATVYILDDAGQRYTLAEQLPGYYQSDSLHLPAGHRYQLRISLGESASAATYESELVPLKVTPDFDRLEFVQKDGQIQLLASTHDPTNQAQYYRWRTYETWEFNAAYKSELEVIGGLVRRRVTPIYTCYRSETPSTVRQARTASLSQNIIAQQVVNSFSDRAERIKIRYSVLVTQYAETAEEFAYYELLRKNTEAVGTVNDPLPAQLTGNVHRVDNPQEPVLGFVGAHTVVQRRLFATPASLGLPKDWVFEDPYSDCTFGSELVPDLNDKISLRIYRPNTRIFKSGESIPTQYYIVGGDTLGYEGGPHACIDCRTRGTIVKPSFW